MASLYLYRRVSSAGQLDGHGLDRQSDYFEMYLKQHPEHTVTKTYSDEGVSGFKGHNLLEGAGLHTFLADLDAGLVPRGSILVVERLDRITRQEPMAAIALLMRIFGHGVSIEAVADGQTYSTADSLMTLILASVSSAKAHEESDKKSKMIGAAWQSKIRDAMADGTPHGKNCPRWIRLSDDGKRYELIPDKADLVTRMFELRLSGHGLLEIANMLNDEGIPTLTPKRKNSSGRWMPESVRDILKSPQCHGQYRERADYYPAVVSYETFQKTQKTFTVGKGQQIANKDDREASSISLLKGLLKCTGCGRNLSLTGCKGKHRGNYRCSSCAYSIPALRLERRIIGAALAWIPVDSPSKEKQQQEKDAITKEVATLTTQRKALTRALRHIESDDEGEEIEADIKQRSERIGQLETVLLEMTLQENSNGSEVHELQQLDWKNSIADRVKAHQLIDGWLKLTSKGHTKILIDFEEMQATIYTVGEFDGEPEIVWVYIGEEKQHQSSEDDGITDQDFWNSVLN